MKFRDFGERFSIVVYFVPPWAKNSSKNIRCVKNYEDSTEQKNFCHPILKKFKIAKIVLSLFSTDTPPQNCKVHLKTYQGILLSKAREWLTRGDEKTARNRENAKKQKNKKNKKQVRRPRFELGSWNKERSN